jgi:V/A-type H+-transporting ATPase subunit E
MIDMSKEAIINQINQDADEEIAQIEKETKEKIDTITSQIHEKTEEMKQSILEKGKNEAENIEKIEISKANQEVKRAQMQAKEEIIETCFQKALDKLKDIDGAEYEEIIRRFLKMGSEQMNGSFIVETSRSIDEKIAKKENITVAGTIDAIGGIRLLSEDKTFIIDNTFEGRLKRNKQDIRVHVGSILFQ